VVFISNKKRKKEKRLAISEFLQPEYPLPQPKVHVKPEVGP
jgi:hypothetical protein